MEAPAVNVGIITEKAVSFIFHGEYVHTETGNFLTGEQRALFVNGNIVFNGKLFKEIFFEPIPHCYLTAVRDSHEGSFPDLTQEEEAQEWIRSTPQAFCHTTDKEILCQVLNNYDQETTDFYRWKVSYKQKELADLIHRKSGISFGQILDLIPIGRGTSGQFTLMGAGWGHGVGLCQIGAAMMAAEGYDYRQILSHYFPGSELEKRY